MFVVIISGKLINPVAMRNKHNDAKNKVKQMVEMKVNASELKGDLINKLSDFLKEKTGGDVALMEKQ